MTKSERCNRNGTTGGIADFDRLIDHWVTLDRGWQAVILGLLALLEILLGVQIPW